jgi:hypothetical protein
VGHKFKFVKLRATGLIFFVIFPADGTAVAKLAEPAEMFRRVVWQVSHGIHVDLILNLVYAALYDVRYS